MGACSAGWRARLLPTSRRRCRRRGCEAITEGDDAGSAGKAGSAELERDDVVADGHRELRKLVPSGANAHQAHDIAKELFSRRLFGSAVPSWKWCALAEAISEGRLPTLERYQAPKPPDLAAIARGLGGLKGLAVMKRLRSLYGENPQWRAHFRTFDEFSSGLDTAI